MHDHDNFFHEWEAQRVENRHAGAAGTPVKGDIVDMLDYDAIAIIVAFQTVVNGSVVTLLANHSDANDTAQMAASTATTGAITSDGTTIALANKQLGLSIVNPTKRYIEPQVTIITQNAPIDHITVYKRPRIRPANQGSTLYSAPHFVSPVNA